MELLNVCLVIERLAVTGAMLVIIGIHVWLLRKYQKQCSFPLELDTRRRTAKSAYDYDQMAAADAAAAGRGGETPDAAGEPDGTGEPKVRTVLLTAAQAAAREMEEGEEFDPTKNQLG